MASFPARPPTGALRPPVAVGPADDEFDSLGTGGYDAYDSGGYDGTGGYDRSRGYGGGSYYDKYEEGQGGWGASHCSAIGGAGGNGWGPGGGGTGAGWSVADAPSGGAGGGGWSVADRRLCPAESTFVDQGVVTGDVGYSPPLFENPCSWDGQPQLAGEGWSSADVADGITTPPPPPPPPRELPQQRPAHTPMSGSPTGWLPPPEARRRDPVAVPHELTAYSSAPTAVPHEMTAYSSASRGPAQGVQEVAAYSSAPTGPVQGAPVPVMPLGEAHQGLPIRTEMQPARLPVVQAQAPGLAASHSIPAPAPPTVPVVPVRAAGGAPGADPISVAEQWVRNYAPPPVGRTLKIQYPCGASVNFQELAALLTPTVAANAPHRARVVAALESGELMRQAWQVVGACDRSRAGVLSWNNGDIRNLIASIFQQQGLWQPDERHVYQLYKSFDLNGSSRLNARECLCLVDALLRGTFYPEAHGEAVAQRSMLPAPPHGSAPHPKLGPGSVAPAPLTGPSYLGPPLMQSGGVPEPLPSNMPQHGSSLPPQGAPLMAAYDFQAMPKLGSQATTLPASEKVMSGCPEHLLDSPLPLGQGRPPLSGPTNEETAPPRPPPKPPAWSECDKRPHVLEVDLEELELLPEAPDLAPRWFESLKYFVSLHPRSEQPQAIPIPRDPPRATVDGKYLVSQLQAPTDSQVRVARPAVATRSTLAIDDDSLGDGSVKARAEGVNPVAQFKEHLALHLDRLDTYLVAYIWGKKSSVMDESFTLIGRSLAPLHEFEFQRRSTTWGVFDAIEGYRVAEVRLKFNVCTTPGCVQQPVVTDVKQTEVTIRWSPPANDHGAPVLGYKVAIMLDTKGSDGPQWLTLCECTKTLNPVYVVANLTGNTTYMVDIRAVNKAGVGDEHEFQIQTAPTQPDPPSKPWVQESRDGCLNVAWRPPASDGGSPIAIYKVKMRKILGASKWNPFGPGESTAIWIDMGSVTTGAGQGPQTEPSVYDAWVGPLESKACEYRFRIVAVNAAGESLGSELSDAHYS